MTLTKLTTFGVVVLGMATAGVLAGGLAKSRPASDWNLEAAAADGPQSKPGQAAAPDIAQADVHEMRGTWSLNTIEQIFKNGEVLPPKNIKVIVVISGDRLVSLGQDGFVDQEWTLKLDPKQKPKAVDLTNTKTRSEVAFRGIYDLNGEILKINMGNGEERPTDFPPGANMWNLTRVSRTPQKTVPALCK